MVTETVTDEAGVDPAFWLGGACFPDFFCMVGTSGAEGIFVKDLGVVEDMTAKRIEVRLPAERGPRRALTADAGSLWIIGRAELVWQKNFLG
jgi:hypothetical protein